MHITKQQHRSINYKKEWGLNDNAKYFDFNGGPIKWNFVS
jgi:hypothetical protein